MLLEGEQALPQQYYQFEEGNMDCSGQLLSSGKGTQHISKLVKVLHIHTHTHTHTHYHELFLDIEMYAGAPGWLSH